MRHIQYWRRAGMFAIGAWLSATVACQPTNLGIDLGPDGWYSGTVAVEGCQVDDNDRCNEGSEFAFEVEFTGRYYTDDGGHEHYH